MIVPEKLQNLIIADLVRIEIKLYCFGMIPKISVAGVLQAAPCVPDTGTVYSLDLPEPGIGTPESAHCKSRSLQLFRYFLIN